MGLRITNKAELNRLINRGFVSKDNADKAKKALSTTSKRDNASMLGICTMPPASPTDRLYHVLVGVYGRYHNGGELVYELVCPFTRKWRLDMAFPRYKLGIEGDGWEWHGKHKEAFKRDRQKSLDFERRGWRVIRFSAHQINTDLEDCLAAVNDIIRFCSMSDNVSITQQSFDRSLLNSE